MFEGPGYTIIRGVELPDGTELTGWLQSNQAWVREAAQRFGMDTETATTIFYLKPDLTDNCDDPDDCTDHDYHGDVVGFTDYVRELLDMPVPVRR